MDRSRDDKRFIVYADILGIFRLSNDIGWSEIRESSIHRVLYLAAVLFSFKFPDKDNLFSNYRFSLEKYVGPYNGDIKNGMDFLLKDDFLKLTIVEESIYALGDNSADMLLENLPHEERIEWLRIIVTILNIYGENKIYDFVFRDKEYQQTLQSGTSEGIDTSPENATLKFLNGFKLAFEETLGERVEALPQEKYIELYFEYVFGQILKRED